MATRNSSKYDNISKKKIRSGSPALYQLILNKEDTGGVTKMTLGQKDLNKPNRTILVVGETGAGKSTLIDALTNYAMGVKWEDDVWFKIVKEEEKSQSVSQTSDVTVYEIFGFEGITLPYSLTIIDTPGYGATGETNRDEIICERLHDLFRSENRVHEINVVGLVLKATENRLSDRSSYIFDSVVSLFGNDMEKNIVCLLTHSDGTKPKDALEALKAANIKCAKDEKKEPVYFLFNNKQKDDRTEDAEILKQTEERTTKALKKFSEFLDKAAPQDLNKTVEVLNLRIRLTSCIQNLQERVEEIELKQKEVQQTQDALKKHEAEMKSNEKFTTEVDEGYKEREPFEGGPWGLWFVKPFYEGAVCCTVCEENCHYPGCTVAWYPKHCKVMEGGRCTVCTGRCLESDHVKEEWIYVNKTRKVQKTLQEMKEKYEKNKTDCEGQSDILETLETEMKNLQKEKDQCLDEAFGHVVKLEQIALKADSLSTHVHLDFLIEKMKEKRDTEKATKLEEIKNRLGEEDRRGLGYKRMRAEKCKKKKKKNTERRRRASLRADSCDET